MKNNRTPYRGVKRQLLQIILVLTIVLGAAFADGEGASAANVAYTQADAVGWARNVVGTAKNWDGVYGVQCVDLIRWYATAIGRDIGAGNAADYAWKALPWDYYSRYNNGTAPLPGDIFVWDKGAYGASSTYGHVGIIVDVTSNGYHYVDYTSQRGCNAILFKNGQRAFSAIIRPNFRVVDNAPQPGGGETLRPSTYTVRNAGTNYQLNYSWGSSGRNFIMSREDGSPEQKFTLEHVGGGKYEFHVNHSHGGVMNVESNWPAAGNAITRWNDNNNDTQRFFVTPVGDGKYLIQSAANKNLVVAPENWNWHSLIRLSNYNPSDTSQLWTFNDLTPPPAANDSSASSSVDSNTNPAGTGTGGGKPAANTGKASAGKPAANTGKASAGKPAAKPATNKTTPKNAAGIQTSGKIFYKGSTYKITGNKASFLKPSAKAAALVIPDAIRWKGRTIPVTEIAANAFKNNRRIRSVKIGKNLVRIGSRAFYGATGLKRVVLRSGKISRVDKKAWTRAGFKTRLTIKTPGGKKKSYKKLFRKEGLTKKAVFR